MDRGVIRGIFEAPLGRGSVRAGATGAIAPVNFQKTPFAPIDFPKSFRKIKKKDVQFLSV